jgi:hypothetical protein
MPEDNKPPVAPFGLPAPTPFIPATGVQTQAEKDAAKSAEEVRLKALNDAKVAEEQKAKAIKDAEAAAKKTAEDNAAKAKKLHEDDLLRQKEAKELNTRVEQKMKERRAEREKQKKETLEEATVILREYGNAESNIPISSSYWGLMNTYRGLQSELR